MIKPKRPAVVVMAIISLFALALPLPAVAQSQDKKDKYPCNEVLLPVQTTFGKQTIAGSLCTKRHGNVKTVDVLLHGATYNRSYWHLGADFPHYSYVQRTLDAGRAVFYYDRLGTGQTSRPDSTQVTLDADAHVLHEVMQWLRYHKKFREVNVIGHSFGSMVAVQEAAKYNDADRIVLTGFLHGLGPALANGELQQYPANQDPKFAGQGYDDGYLTTVPNGKVPFYHLPVADPAVIAYDEANKDVLSSTQLAGGQAQRSEPAATNLTTKIRRPVMVIAGDHDRLYCGVTLDCTDIAAVRALEIPYYPKADSLSIQTVPQTGHDIALHPSNNISFEKINKWLRTTRP